MSDCSRSILASSAAIGFIEHLHSRNQMDMARNARPYAETVMAISGQRCRPVDSYDGEREKQGCEMNAFKRLASRLKKAFLRQGFCRAELIACWGRRRWNIENGFNAQKNDGPALLESLREHPPLAFRAFGMV